ncbi:general secretion pathway protein GspK [Mesorhizobium sp. M1B.F.Ca.ET.045.04.1.1]|uniref:general secretion pathway protein GspK n=1 Tax=Mesorhizobium sp. M1B.F.Ca.ET.045.04.1.1 TaxID=2493673 RepID=UPI00167AEA28|nr:general secretion pathway protein GspK [Mesorhizobium sp. M1B.F.Ca.ET.045.04.1.1]
MEAAALRSDHPGNDAGHGGFALVAVLVFMLLVSAIVVPFALMARTRLMIASNEAEQQRLALVADGLVNVISAELFNGSEADSQSMNGEPSECRAGHMIFEVRVQDHDGLIDLNAGEAVLLARGFDSLGFDRQNAEALARSVISFRTAVSAFESAAERAPSPEPREDKHAPFESVSELQEFSALAATRLHDLYQVFTVNLKRGSINLASAPKRLRDVFDGDREQMASRTTNRSPVYSVEIVVRREGSGIVGRAGFVVERFPQLAAGFRRTALIPGGGIADSSSAMPPSMASCDAMFGSPVAEMLGKWAS